MRTANHKRPIMGRARGRAAVAVLAALLAGLGLLLPGCMQPIPFDEAAWQSDVAATDAALLRAPHRDAEGRFYNPWMANPVPWWGFFRWRLSRQAMGVDPATVPPVPVEANDGAYLADPHAPDSLTWVGHATYALQLGGKVIITDPFFGDYAAVVKREVPPAFGPAAVPAGAVLLISHNHYDHMNQESIAAIGPRASLTLAPLGLADCLREMGAANVRELDWWQSLTHEGVTYTCLPVQHWSRRLGQAHNQSLWCAWLVQGHGHTVLYAADSGYFKGFAEYGRLWPDMDVAILPLGAYLPRWFMHYAHMDVAETLQAFRDLGAKTMVPSQWGVMPLGDEPAAWPAQELRQALQGQPDLKDKVAILPVGGKLALP